MDTEMETRKTKRGACLLGGARPRRGRSAMASALLVLLAGPAAAFTLQLSDEHFGPAGVVPSFGGVENFELEIDFSAPLVAGLAYDNSSIEQVQYLVSGTLSTNPPTPSGFPAFFLDRRETGSEGAISQASWIDQGSSIAFEIAGSADLSDGLQLSELVADPGGLILLVDAREFERLDVARFHPPQIQLFSDGTGVLRNSNNSSGSTGTTNPGTGGPVDVDFGEEYVTDLFFDPELVTLVVPEPGTGSMTGVGLALAGLLGQRARRRRDRSRGQ